MKKLIFLPLLLTFSCLISTKAQLNLFSNISPIGNLTLNQQLIVNKAASTPHIGNLQYVEFLPDSLLGAANHSFNIIINGLGISIFESLTLENVNVIDNNNYTYFYKNSNMQINIQSTPLGKSGRIDIGSRKFSFFPLGLNIAILLENLQIENTNGTCQTEGLSLADPVEGYCGTDCGSGILDILILITPEAYTYLITNYGAFYGHFLFTEFQTINEAFINSDIKGKTVRFSAVNFTPDFSWATDINISLRHRKDRESLEASTLASNLRTDYGADIVLLLTNNNYDPISGSVNSLIPTDINKVAIVEVQYIGYSNNSFTLAHEIGHHFGCTHQMPITPDCPDAYQMPIGKWTLMSTLVNDQFILQNYSNPDVLFSGQPTGITNERNNASQIKGAFCTVADINSIKIFTTDINPSSQLCQNQPQTFVSTTFVGQCKDQNGSIYPCGIPPYTYEWHLSYEPTFTGTQLVGLSKDLTFPSLPCGGCSGFYLKCRVHSADDLYATSIKYYVCPFVPCVSQLTNTNKDKNIIIDENKIIANNQSYVNIINNDKQINNISIFNISGSGVKCEISEYEDRLELNIMDLFPGIYLIKYYIGEVRYNYKFIKY